MSTGGIMRSVFPPYSRKIASSRIFLYFHAIFWAHCFILDRNSFRGLQIHAGKNATAKFLSREKSGILFVAANLFIDLEDLGFLQDHEIMHFWRLSPKGKKFINFLCGQILFALLPRNIIKWSNIYQYLTKPNWNQSFFLQNNGAYFSPLITPWSKMSEGFFAF